MLKKEKNNKVLILVGIILVCLLTLIIVFIALKKNEIVKISSSDIYEGGVKAIKTDELTIFNETLNNSYSITKGGVYNLTGNIEDGSISINTNDNVVLNLDGVSIKNSNGPVINVVSAKNVQINIINEASIECNTTDELNGCIYSKADLRIDGEGKLTLKSNLDGIISKDDLEIANVNLILTTIDDGLVGKDSVVVSSGTVEITSTGYAIKTTNTDKGTINIKGGSISIDSNKDGLQSIGNIMISAGKLNIKSGNGIEGNINSNESSKGIKATKTIFIVSGEININSCDDAMHTDESIQIDGGNITINTLDDAMHAESNINITSGDLTIEKAHEGIEAEKININDGNIKVITEEDGINASGGITKKQKETEKGVNPFEDTNKNNVLTITGGNIYINANGDGLDSNGYIYMSGGNVSIDGPLNGGNGALDYGIEFKITGGTLIAVGSLGMAENVSDSSTQVSVRFNLSSKYNKTITFGNITYTPQKEYQTIVISSPDLEKNKKYNLSIDGKTIETVKLENTVSSFGNQGGPGGNMPPNAPRRNR